MPRKKPPPDTMNPSPSATVERPPSANGSIGSEVLTLAETAAYLRVPVADVLLMVTTQELPGRKIGADWRFFKSALQTWLSTPSPAKGFLSQVGALEDDPHLDEMLKEIYRRRGRPETEEG